jgi:hypothetical protein
MTDNIYIEFDLFLDPAITDPAALREEMDDIAAVLKIILGDNKATLANF